MGKKRGSSKVFSEHEMKQLESNPNVQHVTEKSITYAPAFKLAAVKAYLSGQTPMEIFRSAGFDVDVIGHEKPKHCLKRWRGTYTALGEAGLLEDQRGKGSTGRPPEGKMSTEEKLKRAEARIKLLEAENDFLKKLDALERQKKLRKH
jgi:transposase-like protein